MPPRDCFVAETKLRVRYKETDMMGFVHHTNYITYFEEARSEYARQRGAPYSEFEKAGYFLTVTAINIRYVKPAFYEQELIVYAWITSLKSRGVKFAYEIIELQQNVTLVTGETNHICIDREGKVARLPLMWRQWGLE